MAKIWFNGVQGELVVAAKVEWRGRGAKRSDRHDENLGRAAKNARTYAVRQVSVRGTLKLKHATHRATMRRPWSSVSIKESLNIRYHENYE